MSQTYRKTVGLALGSGGIRGLAHVGVLRTLVQNKIPIDFIAGSSMGAGIGALYAAHKNIATLEEVTIGNKRDKLKALLEIQLRKGGLIKGHKVRKLLKIWLGDITFADLAIPLTVVATDILSGKQVNLNQGPVVPAVHASTAVPLMFAPVPYNDYLLVDGGLTNPLPSDIVRAMGADIVIAVNVDHSITLQLKKEEVSIPTVSLQSLRIIRNHLAQHAYEKSDVVIEPPINDIGIVAWKRYFTDDAIDRIVAQGSEATKPHIEHIKKLIAE